jgi:hypothetical protein
MPATSRVSDVCQERITCFIDILGFSRDIARVDSYPSLLCLI